MPKLKTSRAVGVVKEENTAKEELTKLVKNVSDLNNESENSGDAPSVHSRESKTLSFILDDRAPSPRPFAAFEVSSDSSDSDNEEEDDSSDKKAAWIDENDIFSTQEVFDFKGQRVNLGSKAANEYKQTLEEKYKSIMGVPNWAKKRHTDSNVTLLTKTGSLLKKTKSLKKDKLEIQKLQDLNRQTHTEGSIIKSVLFHPTSTVALVAGTNSVASLFQVDGRENTKLQSIKFRKFPISCGAFLRNGEEFMVGSRHHKYFYTHDLISGHSQQITNNTFDITNVKNFSVTPDGRFIAVCGKFGDIHLLSSKTKEHISTLHMNDDVSSLGFYEEKMFSHGSEGTVYIWDLKTRNCVHKFIDDGCLTGTSITISRNGKLAACGSSSGVVNLYDLEKAYLDKAPIPIKTIYNLVTEIDSMKFNATSEILCFSSQQKDNAIKLFHCPSMTVYSNFPTLKANLHKVQCVDFSPNSGYLALGDNYKTAHLFRLKHYGNY